MANKRQTEGATSWRRRGIKYDLLEAVANLSGEWAVQAMRTLFFTNNLAIFLTPQTAGGTDRQG